MIIITLFEFYNSIDDTLHEEIIHPSYEKFNENMIKASNELNISFKSLLKIKGINTSTNIPNYTDNIISVVNAVTIAFADVDITKYITPDITQYMFQYNQITK